MASGFGLWQVVAIALLSMLLGAKVYQELGLAGAAKGEGGTPESTGQLSKLTSLFTLSPDFFEAKNPLPAGVTTDTVTIQYCVSCSYQGAYQQVAQLVHNRALAVLDVQGVPFKPSPAKQLVASVAQTLQMALLACVLGGKWVCETLGIPVPEFINTLSENKMTYCFGIWMLGNVVVSQCMSTKAFEIYKGHTLVWSSLAEKRMPQLPELLAAFRKVGVDFQPMH